MKRGEAGGDAVARGRGAEHGDLSRGCLAGNEAGAAGSRGPLSGEVPLSPQFPGLPLPLHPAPRGGLVFSPPGHKPVLYSRPLQMRLLGSAKLGRGEGAPALETPRAPLKHPLCPHPPPNQSAGEPSQAALCTKQDRRRATGRDSPMRSKGSLA